MELRMKKAVIAVLMVSTFLACFFFYAGSPASAEDAAVEPPDYRSFLKIDAHAHIFADLPAYVKMLRRNNIKNINICTGGTDSDMVKLQQGIAEKIQAAYPDSFRFASTFDLNGIGEDDYSARTDQWLTSCVDSGAIMFKIWKEVGMEIKDENGDFIMPDNQMFDPIYRRMAQLGQPLLGHLAEPVEAWRPLDPEGVHYNYYKENPEWHFYNKEGVPSWEAIIKARDNVLEKHRSLTFIGAHLGSMAFDVDEVAGRLDRYPNFYVDVAARTKDLSRQPREKVREFFIKYQDRILYGVDLVIRPDAAEKMSEEEIENLVSGIEAGYRADWDYYAGSGPMKFFGREVEGLNLPAEVLEKFYFRNARRIIPRLKL